MIVNGYNDDHGFTVLRLDGNNPGPATSIVRNDSSGEVFTPRRVNGINNLNQHFFTGYIYDQAPSDAVRIMTGITNDFPNGILYSPPFPPTTPNDLGHMFPMIADTGKIIARAGTTSTNPLRLYDYNFAAHTDLAIIGPNDFSEIGVAPGISDDGKVAVFAGILNSNSTPSGYNTRHMTSSGPGIFAVVDIGLSNQRIIRLANRKVEDIAAAGGNDDGVCDPTETCQDGELGFDLENNPLLLSTFDLETRVGVTHQGTGTLDGDTIVVAFIATPNGEGVSPRPFTLNKGLWTVRVDFRSDGTVDREKPHRPLPVVQEFDRIGGNTIANLSVNPVIGLYDPIAIAATEGGVRTERLGDHRIAFSAVTNNGAIVVRATQTDNDEDGLYDHWETSGIDFNGDGGEPDLKLQAAPFNANPNRKDIFVEIDYMQARNHSHRPSVAGLDEVKNAFASAPNLNPDGSTGITLHSIVDEILPETQLVKWYAPRVPGALNDFRDYKYGEPYNPCSIGRTAGRFGTRANRSNTTNCLNILGARQMAFRYAIFGHLQRNQAGNAVDSGGVAEISGNDLFITATSPAYPNQNVLKKFKGLSCNRGETDITCGRREYELGSYFHELGHTLSLRHGGEQFENCKPNYLSAMNYSLQFKDVDRSRALDFSRSSLPNLIESSLNEPNGIGGPTGRLTASGDNSGGPPGLVGYYPTATSGAVDWNRNGPATDVTASQNINFVTKLGCNNDDNFDTIPDGLGTLTSTLDWPQLLFSFRDSQDFGSGNGRGLETTERSSASVEAVSLSSDEDGDGFSDGEDKCLGLANPNQTDSDGDGFGDACDNISSDLSVSMTATPVHIRVGQQITYTVTITNQGPTENAAGIYMLDELPPHLRANEVTTTHGECSESEGGVICEAPDLAVGSSMIVNISATALTAGSLVNTVNVENGIGDTNLTNNTATIQNTSMNAAVPRFDLDGDGLSDAVVWRPSTGTWYVVRTVDQAIITQIWGEPGDKPAPADFDGDVLTDFAIFRPSTGVWWIIFSSSSTIGTFNWGVNGDKPVPGDYDGDGQGDFAVYRPSNGTWYILASGTYTMIQTAFGTAEDKPVHGDYDGDGVTEVAVFRPSTSVWYIRTQSAFEARSFGQSGDKLVPGDYDGDGKTDLGLWRPSDGKWYTAPLIETEPNTNHTQFAFGTSGDVPQQADYDGDGKTDYAIWKPNTGQWSIRRSSNGTIYTLTWGVDTDIPVAAAYSYE